MSKIATNPPPNAFFLPAGITVSQLQEVTITHGNSYHVASPWHSGMTLCGMRHTGTDKTSEKACYHCGKKLLKIIKANP